MSDQETTENNVVDRRSAAKEASDPRPDSSLENASERADETTAGNSGAESTPPESEGQASEPSSNTLPDPSTIFAMAAMHLSTTELAMTLLSVFDGHAWRAMGMVADHNGELQKDLPSAQMSIDCLAFLLGKVESSLEETDRRDVQRRLNDLRMNYLAKLREG